VAVEGLKLRVQVLVVVRSVLESVQANTVFVVGVYVTQLHSIPARGYVRELERDLVILEEFVASLISFGPLGLVIDAEVVDRHAVQVEEKLAILGVAA